MSQHFLLSRAAKTLSLAQVFRMTDAEAEATFRKCAGRDGRRAGLPALRRLGRLRLPPPERRAALSLPRVRQGFHDHLGNAVRLATSCPLRGYLAAIAIFCNEVKGKSALALSRDLALSYKTRLRAAHKLREAMAEEMKGRVVGGEGKVAEVDGGYFGGYVKPANLAENRVDRRLSQNQTGKRKVVVIVRERGGNSVPAVFRSESQASILDQGSHRQGDRRQRRRSDILGRSARPFRNEADQPSRGLQPRRRLHELGGGIFQPPASRRDRPSPPYRRRLFAPLRARGFMARGSSPRVAMAIRPIGWRGLRWRKSESGFHGILAAQKGGLITFDMAVPALVD